LDTENEKDLLQQVALGDEAAFTRLFGRYSDWVYATALRLTESPELAEEITQEVFLKVWVKRAELAHVEKFPDWLFIVARNHSYTIVKRLLRRQAITRDFARHVPSLDNETDAAILYRDYQSVLQEAINRLPTRQNEVYKLSRQQGLKNDEIAGILGISPHTVKIHLREALHSIRDYCRSRIDVELILLLLFLRR
jgi:RNA polymerase sigma-70 factor (family 1)